MKTTCTEDLRKRLEERDRLVAERTAILQATEEFKNKIAEEEVNLAAISREEANEVVDLRLGLQPKTTNPRKRQIAKISEVDALRKTLEPLQDRLTEVESKIISFCRDLRQPMNDWAQEIKEEIAVAYDKVITEAVQPILLRFSAACSALDLSDRVLHDLRLLDLRDPTRKLFRPRIEGSRDREGVVEVQAYVGDPAAKKSFDELSSTWRPLQDILKLAGEIEAGRKDEERKRKANTEGARQLA